MRYEKKMLILSGKGKGVVMIERSGAGVRFSLRTFGLAPTPQLKAGIVTPRTVIIRDLPPIADPSAMFVTDDLDLDKLHFAVFDDEIILYGATGERMWESNLTDILLRRDRMTSPTPTPQKLPPSDGKEYTRLPPPELAVRAAYLDEAMPRDDFYTPFDYSARLSEVDAFLDAPRALNGERVTGSILDGLAPTVTPSASANTDNADNVVATNGAVVSDEATDETNDVAEISEFSEVSADETDAAAQVASAPDAEISDAPQPENTEEIKSVNDNIENAEPAARANAENGAETRAEREAAATAEPEVSRAMPWEMESKFLSMRGGRKVVKRTARVEPVRRTAQIKKLRDLMFFERSRADIDKLFASAPKDENLGKLLPDVHWVSVELAGGTVSVGRGGDSFLCYAVGGTYAINPFGEDAQWLPTQADSPTGRGYWLIFQSLSTGDIIRTE